VTFHCIDRRLSKWNRFAKSMFHLGEWLACHFAHRTITVSQTLTRYCMETYGCQVTYIPHPFVLPDTIPSDEALRAHDLAVEQYLLFVGRLIPDKQAHQLIKGYGLARQRRPDLFSHLPLVMVGGGSWTDRYVQWLYQLGASFPGVRMLGERCGTELQSLQAHALGHVFPTASEGLSIAILEAGAFRRPVLCTLLPENHEATGGHGIAMNSRDVEDVCRGLIEIASLTLTQRKSMGEGLHLHVKKTFDANIQINATIDTYKELLAGDLLTVPAAA
jgi:glycosyltransferase involved in cell wall biosynthesis